MHLAVVENHTLMSSVVWVEEALGAMVSRPFFASVPVFTSKSKTYNPKHSTAWRGDWIVTPVSVPTACRDKACSYVMIDFWKVSYSCNKTYDIFKDRLYIEDYIKILVWSLIFTYRHVIRKKKSWPQSSCIGSPGHTTLEFLFFAERSHFAPAVLQGFAWE